MVYLKRYGYKFYPPDGENTKYVSTRWISLLIGILLAFFYAGLDIEFYPYVVLFFVTLFILSVVGEFLPRAGLALILIVSAVLFVACIGFQFRGYGADDAIGLLYLYPVIVSFAAWVDFRRSKNSKLTTNAYITVCIALSLAGVVGFGDSQLWAASLNVDVACGWDKRSRWSAPELLVRRATLFGEYVVILDRSRGSYNRNIYEFYAYRGNGAYGKEKIGRILGMDTRRQFGREVLGLHISPSSSTSRMLWIGGVSAQCRELLTEYIGSTPQ